MNRYVIIPFKIALIFIVLQSYFLFAVGDSVDYGLLFRRSSIREASDSTFILGPFFERKRTDNIDYIALHPFYSSVDDSMEEKKSIELLWPFMDIKYYKSELFWRVLIAFGYDYDIYDPYSGYRVAVLPFVYWGKDKRGNGYLAVFPFGGTIRDFPGFEKIDFFFFPLWCKAVKEKYTSWNIMWPVFSWIKGKEIEGFRFFPFYGYLVDKYKRSGFVLWPFFTFSRYYGRDNGTAWLLFPFLGHIDIPDKIWVWTFAYPFFKAWGDDTSLKGINFLWPLLQIEKTSYIDKFYIWPFFGRKILKDSYSGFVLWPVCSWNFNRILDKDNNVKGYHNRISVMPFCWYEIGYKWIWKEDITEDVKKITEGILWKVWPIISYKRRDNSSLLRILDLWPSHTPAPIERNYSRLWSLYSRSVDNEYVEHEILWGCIRIGYGNNCFNFSLFPVYSYLSQPDRKEWNVFLGLVGRWFDFSNNYSGWRFIFIRWNAGGK